MLTAKDLNPRWFGAPASTLLYLLTAAYAVIFAVGFLLGIFKSPSDFSDLYYSDPSVFYLSGRLIGVLFSILSIVLIYLISRKIFKDELVVFFASLLSAICPLLISNAKTVRMDSMMTFLILASFWFCLKILEKEPKNTIFQYCFASFLLGLAIATKYPSIVFSTTILGTYILGQSWRSSGLEKVIFSSTSCILGCFIGSPFLFLNFDQVLNDVAFESRSEHLGATGQGLVNNLIWYLNSVIPDNLTYLSIPFMVVGLICCLTSRKPQKILLTIFPIAFLLFISSLSLRWDRWLIPALPFLGILIAYGIYEVTHYIRRVSVFKNETFSKALIMSVLFIFITNIAVIDLRVLTAPDTRTEAREWMLENLPPGSSLLMETYSPQLPKEHFQYFWVNQRSITEFNADAAKDQTFRVRWSVIGEVSLADIEQLNIEYVVLSNRYRLFVEDQENYPSVIKNYEDIFDAGELIYENKGSEDHKKGPTIQIYKFS
jgi:hypothetical protein